MLFVYSCEEFPFPSERGHFCLLDETGGSSISEGQHSSSVRGSGWG